MAESEEQSPELPSLPQEDTAQGQKVTPHAPQPRLCRFYSQGRYCQFGQRCRFRHQRVDHKLPEKKNKLLVPNNTVEQNAVAEQLAPHGKDELNRVPPKAHPEPLHKQHRNRKLCWYFASGYCSMDQNCRFWHPQKLPAVHDNVSGNKKPPSRTKVERPSIIPKEIKFADLTVELATKLRETEISQLLKRFPKDKLIVQEREDGKVTYYRVTVEPTDPDWPFDLKEIEILLEFPEDYPLQVFTIQIPEDQDLPSVMGRHVCDASKAWLDAKHATNQLVGKVELLFRPFLLWLDRNLERLYTEGARLLKRDIDAENAGLEFVPYQQLQAAVAVKSSKDENVEDTGPHETNLQEDLEDDDSDSWISCDEDDDDLEPGTGGDTIDGMRNVEGGAAVGPRKGTEIRFLGLKLGAGVGTLTPLHIVVSLQCGRCNVTADLSMTGKQPCSAQCEKCNSRISGTFLPSILHQYSTLLGYVDIQGATARDLVLLECTFMINCLNCSHEEPIKSLSYGITKELNCVQCHSKLSIFSEATRFQKIQRYLGKDSGSKDGFIRKKTMRDPSIQPGKPLPDRGTCRHYRKSYRWLRFPCCGKAYPCDSCHDEAETHEMDLASRMLCGYCAKEQPYSNGKACISCGNMMTRNIHAIHWEGGKGCRNKIKMSRKDKQKYNSSSKTVSRKSVSKK
ncbi:uncharacterized protein LOC120985594 [Bufo bufo]|uniref:uncharacterized protein LOC120985594 n=1 Tax=Bufo bufo TaxID=8384 RepID=UPI001ABECDC4|nr:uncharacterized protein LOC120985594 [Bufo bufo]XP_040269547.1 uncharacterized protein LOC120985594 [Bufo bufo]XP_040269548.1 uncharacterized protein LOC120985594 [Bufo bufo]